ncbi:hypothetical protein DPMN_111520 [Dreissena polymorpha]|uniref:Uncharacterized protein n=1 Tax=Dreissena polymorpha TaxID=45954 RepID=A0A9D4KES5_DREPO|nr:hypothetical protein DPMN_111520 [Dreissena polymorpha]
MPCKACARHEQLELYPCNNTNPMCMVVAQDQTEQASCSTADDNQTPSADCEPDVFRQRQIQDPDIMSILRSVESGIKPEWVEILTLSSKRKTLWRQWGRLKIVSRVLYLKFYDEEDN